MARAKGRSKELTADINNLRTILKMRLRRARTFRRYSLNDVARIMQLSPSLVSRWEKWDSESMPGLVDYVYLCRACQFDLAALLSTEFTEQEIEHVKHFNDTGEEAVTLEEGTRLFNDLKVIE